MKLSIIIVLAAAVLLTGCQKRTPYGECVGAFDDRQPHLEYKLSTRNTVLGIIFIETVFVPVIVVANETVCPVARKP